MAITIVWLALMATGAAWEVYCRRPGSRWTSLSGLAGKLARRLPGRIVLLVLWAFVGWHVFARYTIPR